MVGADAEQAHRAGDLLEHVGEVLGAHHGELQLEELALAEHRLGHVLHEPDGPGVVDGDGVALLDRDRRAGVEGRGDGVGQPLDREVGLIACVRRDGTDRAREVRRLRDDVGGRSGLDLGDGDDRGFECVDLGGDHRLDRGDEMGRDGHRVGCEVRGRRMPAGAAHRDPEHVGRGHDRPGPTGDPTRGYVGRDVQRVGRVDTVEHPLVDHHRRATHALLAGLEHEPDRAGEPVATAGEHASRPDEHRGVGVVPARVSPPVDPALEPEVGVLRHR